MRAAPLRIYYYGPFSFDLRETLSTMEGLDVVQTVPHEWGATYRIGKRYPQVKDRFPKTLQKLEPLATALFLKRERPDANDDALAARLHEIKPHVTVEAARVALQKVGGWMAATA